MDTIEYNGREFKVTIELDERNEPPWENECGHGSVSDWTQRDYHNCGRIPKAPGERVLHTDGRAARLYDWQGAMAIAKRDGWGLCEKEKAKLAARLGREPTAGELTAEAVQRDFDRLRAWCAGDWYYVGVVVEDPDTHDTLSLWGIESDCEDYMEEVAHELAAEFPTPEYCEKCGQVVKP